MKKLTLDLNNPPEVLEIKEDCEIGAVFVGKGDTKVSVKTVFLHKQSGTHSRINIKAVVLDESKFDFEGLLRIEKGATGVDTYLSIKCLVLSPKASARAVPSLEILESEVKAGHGATIGYLDPAQLYYLKSRGLSEEQSKEILVEGFLMENS